ncbi:hypothetical protein [endosymbiont GvMRE of Glomus versiforme]|uniref:hypothetical protein n=1 Tax=endosymbiont GvMRE of Glomus versiforme TaxID=2039283 RepID=UPI0011C4AAD2|nr:hypothetical protein [endosymbiont GvMRE of Glomus versiforme]
MTERERERERESKPEHNSPNDQPIINNPQLNQFFSKAKQKIIQIYGENSKEYQELLEQQQLLSNASREEQKQFLNLAQELSKLESKLIFNPETKVMDLSKLSPEEQAKYSQIIQEISELLTKLKQKQAKQEQKSDNLKLALWIGGSFILGAGLVGLIVLLVVRKKKD